MLKLFVLNGYKVDRTKQWTVKMKDIKFSVENLEKKEQLKEDNNIQEIGEAQQVIDTIIVANSDAKKTN